MKLVSAFDVELKVYTFNAGDVLEWIPYRIYTLHPHSICDVQAHDHGRCKLRIEWSQYGGRELGIHSQGEVLLLQASKRPSIPILDGSEKGSPAVDEMKKFLRENWELVRQYYFDLPGQRYDRPPTSPV